MTDTKDRIVRAAVRSFQKHGYHGTGMAALMEAADVRKSSLYHHFPGGKEAIAIAALDWLTHQILGQLDEMGKKGAGGSAMVQAMIDRGQRMAGTDQALRGSLFAVLAWDCIPEAPEIAKRLELAMTEIQDRLTEGFQREGSARADDRAIASLALVEGSMLLSRIGVWRTNPTVE